MKLLLVIPKYTEHYLEYDLGKSYDYHFPLGLAYILSAVKSKGYFIDALNMNHYKEPMRTLIKSKLDKQKYDFVLTGNNAIGYDTTKIIFDSVRNHISQPKIILGGPIITSEPELIFNDLKPNFGIIGEGEKTIVELLEGIENKKDLKKIPGLIFEEKGKIIITEKRKLIMDLDSIPFPEVESLGFEEYLNNAFCNWGVVHSLFDKPRIYSLVGSRSCPFHCTFCYHYDDIYRERSIKNIMEELSLVVKKYRINIIRIYDECFAVDKKRLKEFCEGIKKLKGEISWDLKWFPQLRVDSVDEETLKMMKDSGCAIISYGFESYSPLVLKSMRKNITPEKINHAFNETIKQKIAVQACFIFGDIAETKETAYETLNYWKRHLKGQVELIFIEPYPCSEIYKHCIKKGIIKNRLSFIKNLKKFGNFNFNMTNSMSDRELKKLDRDLSSALAKYRKFVIPLSMRKTNKNLYKFKVKCPFCSDSIEYGNCIIVNPLSYSFNVICRNCGMRFFITSSLRKFVYKHYDKFKKLRDLQLSIKKYIRKRKQ